MDTMDRISELPDPILHHIMSFLPLQQVVQTIVLSKRWKQLWDTFPILEFDGSWNSFSRNKMILRYLEQTLQNRHTERISVKKLVLRMLLPEDSEFLTLISQCLSHAIESNVKRLKLSLVNGFYSSSLYCLPQFVFCSKSLDDLELQCCNLVVPKSNFMLSSLRRLYLSHVAADDHVIENLVVGSPLIEHLKIILCRGLTSLQLAGLNRLKNVIVCDNDALQRLKINLQNVHDIYVSALSLCEINIAVCENLKCLTLRELSITDKCLCNEISKCPLLESLSIHDCNKLESIKVSSPCLKTLCLFECSKLFEVKIETPNLRIFKYGGDLISFSSNGLALSEADLHFDSDNIDTQWFVRYTELLAKFHRFSKALTLHSITGENAIVPRDLREILCPPLSGVNQLNLKVHQVDCSFAEFIDGLLWISPHVETIFAEQEDCYNFRNKFTIQLSYKKELICEGGSKTPSCCQSLPVSCWQHCMKEVNIETARTHRGKTIKAKRFCLQDEQLLEKIDGLCLDSDSSEDEIDVPEDGTDNADNSD